jgi:transcription initiation factor IIE alpha subunit
MGEKVALLKVFRAKLVPDQTNNMAKDMKVFEQYYEYYFYTKSTHALNNIKLRKKDIIKELHSDDFIKNYTSNNQIDFSKEPEVIKLINKYNAAL